MLLWAVESALVTGVQRIPPFQIAFLGFAATALGVLPFLMRRGMGTTLRRLPLRAWAVSVLCLLGFHVCLYHAVQTAPPAQAALMLGFTPLLIVFGSALLPGERLRWWHVAGVLLGLAGSLGLVARDAWGELGGMSGADPLHLLAAVAAAVIWASYSLASRTFPAVPTSAVGAYCAGAAVVAGLGHGLFEDWVTPTGAELAVILALGLLPAGLATFLWDHGVKRGDIQVLGVLAYGEPLLGAAFVILLGAEELSWPLLAAAVLIVGGALLASRDLWRRPLKEA